jgi:hypothetical protein
VTSLPQRDLKCGAQPVRVLPNGSFDAAMPAWILDPPTTALIGGSSWRVHRGRCR